MQTLVKLLADGLMFPIIVLAAYALILKAPVKNRYDTYTRIFMAGITSYMFAKFLGAWWQPEALRPFEKLGLEAGASYLNNPGFPSDHALFAGFLTLAVWYGTRHRKLTIAMVVLTLMVCVGRVLALVHTPLDVIGGLLVAGIGSVWYWTDLKKVFRKRLAKRSNK